MDIAHPIRAVASTLDGPVLELLARTARPLSGREVHRLIGLGSPSGVRLALLRLSGQGVVTAQEHAATTFFIANREHLAWPAIEILARLRRTLIERLIAELRMWQTKPVHASLFGSLARREGNTDSDIDLLLIREDETAEDQPPWADQVDQLRYSVRQWTGNNCHMFQLNSTRLLEHRRASDPLLDNWLRDAVTLFGAELPELVGDLPTLGTV